MSVTREEVIAAYAEHGFTPSESDIASELDNSSRYGDTWDAQFQANLDERDHPTASAGGSGGDIDLDGDGNIDPGWFLVSDGGDPGFVRDPSLVKDGQYIVNVGGSNAGQAVSAADLVGDFIRDTNIAVGLEIDKANLTGAFDDGDGRSAAGIAAIRATTGGKILSAAQGRFLGLIGTERTVQAANAAPGQSLSLRPPVTSAGTTLAIPGVANRGVATGGAVTTSTTGGVVSQTPRAALSSLTSASPGGFSPVMLGGLALAAYFLFR